jgi:hypothetical protein
MSNGIEQKQNSKTEIMKEIKMHSIGKEKAIALCDSGWWRGKSPREIVSFQLFTEELSMDFGDFQVA